MTQNARAAQPHDAVAELCPACGMCCNGVLFTDVELRPKDNPDQLAGLGLEVQRKGQKLAFAQPCGCFDGRCRIYPQRPRHCRAFECGVLRRVQKGELTSAQGLTLIRRARRQVKKVQGLLRALGDHREELPLTHRYIAVMEQPFNLSGDAALVRKRAQLLTAMNQLMTQLQQNFLS